MLVAVYPTVRDNPDLTKLVQQYPQALKSFLSFGGGIDYTSGAGYLGTCSSPTRSREGVSSSRSSARSSSSCSFSDSSCGWGS
jgi:hypothetical protein